MKIIFLYTFSILSAVLPFYSLKNDASAVLIQENKVRFESWLHKNHKQGIFPSLAVAVVNSRGISYSYYINSDPHKKYGLASITKTFTATALMLQKERHNFSMDTQVVSIFPGLTIERKELNSEPVTIRHLLTHTSGMPDLRFYKDRNFLPVPGNNPEIKIPLQIYPAGKHYRYSNHGFIVIGKIIEKFSRQPLHQFMFQNIFNPLGMTDTVYNEYYTGAYGLNSSLRDMSRYAQFLIHDGYIPQTGIRVMKKETMLSMREFQWENQNSICHEYCGLGWRAVRIGDSVLTYYHIGGNTKIGAWIQIFPFHKMAVIYLSDPPLYNNRTMDFLFQLQSELAYMVGLESGFFFNIQTVSYPVIPGAQYQKYTGTYYNLLNRKKIVVYLKEGQMYINDNERRDYMLFPRSRYIFQGGYEFLTHQFIPSPEGTGIASMARFDGYYTKK